MGNLHRDQKREWAESLYVREGRTQKEIAARVDVTEKTIGAWKEKYKWDDLKASFTISRAQQLRMFNSQINELNDEIHKREPGKRYANSKEADTLVKLANAVKALETEVSISETISVGKDFIDNIKRNDVLKAQEVAELFDQYIKTLL